MDKNFEIMNALLSVIIQTDEWVQIQTHDPLILAAQKKWETAIDKIRTVVSDDIVNELEEALNVYMTCYDDTAVLYGFRMAIALMDAVNRPLELSQYILDHSTLGHQH